MAIAANSGENLFDLCSGFQYTIGVAGAYGDLLVSQAPAAVWRTWAHRDKETGLQLVRTIRAHVSFFLCAYVNRRCELKTAASPD